MTPRRHTEAERKYAVSDQHLLPTFDGPDAPRLGRAARVELKAVYFDTPQLDLHREGITLRRRTGGGDEGWHLKLPRVGDHRQEIQEPLGDGSEELPRLLLDHIRAIVRDHPLCQVATIRTDRLELALVDTEDHQVATVCDDHVTAVGDPGRGEQVWREWEVELAEDQPPALLDLLEEQLARAGATAARHGSKLERALGAAGVTAHLRTPTLPPPESAGAVLRGRLLEQVRALHEQDVAVRASTEEGVHQMRIAARRLRSALTTARSLLQPGAAEPVRDELRWLGMTLSPARDAQVLLLRLGAALDSEPAELVMGPVRARLDLELRRAHQEGVTQALEMLDADRYFRLLDALDALVADLPLSEAGRMPAEEVVPHLIRRDTRRLWRAVTAATESGPQDRDAALHEARKKAKRLRYAAELAEPVGGKGASRLAARAKAVQQALGEHQDTVVARLRLRELGAKAFLEGENGFTFGLLYGMERLRAEMSERALKTALKDLPRPRVAAEWVSG
ncbi:MAG TPA: CYTH and CHAD domain-containing protein [Pedococcus sp.]|nr:CYTH and CHAD domain-containing protein [Pedococcus sp.]